MKANSVSLESSVEIKLVILSSSDIENSFFTNLAQSSKLIDEIFAV